MLLFFVLVIMTVPMFMLVTIPMFVLVLMVSGLYLVEGGFEAYFLGVLAPYGPKQLNCRASSRSKGDRELWDKVK